ncbi:MAG: helix-turn-helix domain-containing protein [Pseudomonadota bacterium]|nr:helix-turn-helix domain-containing protein [Pseudomonadota bacterium]
MPARFWLGPTQVDLVRNELRRGPTVAHLTGREAALLGFLADRAGADVSRAELLREVFGYHPGVESRAVDFTVHRLRRKLESEPSRPAHLVSSPGHGYRLDGLQPDEGAPTASVPAPSPVPPPSADPLLLGRIDELAELCTWADGPPGQLFLVGPGGIGKTRLARALLALREEGVFVDLSLSDAASLDVAASVRSATGGPLTPGALLVLDNAEHVHDAVVTWLSTALAYRVLVTSRVSPDSARTLGLSPLGPEDGLRLLRRRQPDLDDTVGRTLVDALDGLPLALELAAARLATVPAESLARRLVEGNVRLLRREGGGRQGSLDALLAWSWALLGEPSRALLRASVVFATPFEFDAIEEIGALDAVEVADGLAEAERHHWLARQPDGRFRLAPPVRAWLGEAPAEALARHTRWCLGPRAPLADRIRAFDRARDADTRLTLALALPADEFAPDESMAARAARLRALLAWFPDQAHLHWALGMACAMSGARAEAATALETGARLAAGAEDERLLGKIEGQLGNVAAYSGDSARAVVLYEQAVTRLVRLGDRGQAATFRANLGAAWLGRGDLVAAEEQLLLALGDMEGTARAANRGRLHANLATLYLRRAQPERSDLHDGLAERSFREANDRMCLGQLLGNRAVRHLDAGALSDARVVVAEALSVHRQLGNLRSEALALMTLGDIAAEEGDLDALQHFATAAARLGSAGDVRFEGWARWRWGRALVLTGGDGLAFVRQGIRMTASAGDSRGAGIGQWVLAALDPSERAAARAEDALTRSLAAVLDRRPPELRDHEVRMQERLCTFV